MRKIRSQFPEEIKSSRERISFQDEALKGYEKRAKESLVKLRRAGMIKAVKSAATLKPEAVLELLDASPSLVGNVITIYAKAGGKVKGKPTNKHKIKNKRILKIGRAFQDFLKFGLITPPQVLTESAGVLMKGMAKPIVEGGRNLEKEKKARIKEWTSFLVALGKERVRLRDLPRTQLEEDIQEKIGDNLKKARKILKVAEKRIKGEKLSLLGTRKGLKSMIPGIYNAYGLPRVWELIKEIRKDLGVGPMLPGTGLLAGLGSSERVQEIADNAEGHLTQATDFFGINMKYVDHILGPTTPPETSKKACVLLMDFMEQQYPGVGKQRLAEMLFEQIAKIHMCRGYIPSMRVMVGQQELIDDGIGRIYKVLGELPDYKKIVKDLEKQITGRL